MKKTGCLLALSALFWAALAVSGASGTFPLHFKKLDARTAFHSPEGYCTVVILSETKPPELLKEPPATSRKLYARLFSKERPVVFGDNFPTPPTMATWGQPVMIMRLTERTLGEGFDTVIIDLNGNGDLTDDPVLRDHKVSRYRKFFGPFTLPLPEGTLPQGSIIEPVMYLESGFLSAPRSYMDPATGKFIDFVGFAAIRSGWVLEGTLDVPPLLQRVAFKDAYCDFAFSQEVSHREVLNDDLYFDGGRKVSSIEFFPSDYVLRDYNNNASFDCELPLNECEPYGKYIHIKEKLYTWQIAPDLQSFSVAPVEESLATGFFESARSSDKRTQVALKTGYQPPSATNGTFHGDGKWQLITIDANTRKVELPAGEYLLSQFALRSRDAERNIAHLPLSGFGPREAISFTIAKDESFQADWGQPLKLTLNVCRPEGAESANTLQLYIDVTGKRGETYSDFSVYKPASRSMEPLTGPRVEILSGETPVGSHQFMHDFLGWWWQIPAELQGKKVTLVPFFEEFPVGPVPLEVQLP